MLVHMLHFFHFLRVNNERANKEGNIFSCDVIFDSTDVTQSTWPLPSYHLLSLSLEIVK